VYLPRVRADVYKTDQKDTYLFLPRRKDVSTLDPKIIQDNTLGKVSLTKTVNLKIPLRGIDSSLVDQELSKQGYSIKSISATQSGDLGGTLKKFLKTLLSAQGFALLSALIFVSGFLCIFTFLDRFGIHGEDFLKSRYIQAGILFMLFPVTILLPIILIVSLKNIEKSELVFKFPYSTILGLLNISFVFYLFIFSPRNFIFSKLPYVAMMIILTFLGPYTDKFVKSVIIPRFHIAAVFARWFFASVMLGLDVLIFYTYRHPLFTILWGQPWSLPDGAIWYFIFIILIAYAMWRVNGHAAKLSHPRGKMELKMLGFALGLMFLFLGIMAFATRAYPHIPVAKGGGNYSESPTVNIAFKPLSSGNLASSLTNDPTMLALSMSNCFVVIERTSTTLYLANIHQAGGPTNWCRMHVLPDITEVRIDTIEHISYRTITDTNYPIAP
jgi:uncharacterized protein YcgL (UPF0745 family)